MPVTKGKSSVSWKRPEYDFTTSGDTAVVRGEGLYTACLGDRPALGTAGFRTVAKTFVVKRVIVRPGRTNDGTIEVQLAGNQTGEANETDDEGTPPIYELDWGTESHPVERHRKLGVLLPTRPFYEFPASAYSLTGNRRYNIAEAEACDFPVAQRTFENWNVLDLHDYSANGGWALDQYKLIREAGRDDFSVAFPIARSTRFYSRRPTGVGDAVWETENPPEETSAPSTGWVYYKSADRLTFEGGRFKRTEEWEGRLPSAVDLLLYQST